MASTALIDGFPRVGLTPTVVVTLDPGDSVNGCRWFWWTDSAADTASWVPLAPETATVQPYLIQPQDEFTYIRARIKFASSPTAWTTPIGPVASDISYVTTSVVVAPGTAIAANSFSADGDKAQAYEWHRKLADAPDEDWAKINAATAARYVVQQGDIGYVIRPAVKFKQAGTIHATSHFGPVTRA